ncbi:hypothetical protein ACO0RG_002698 [Hanseniaspora osmophila]|uniref:Peroxisomal targeting signal receptor n=1 Tax=Hanseniaspora osmophila TaxID=56408 RepID=A0A1E5R7Q9_9ASCO|nr:Peroxisomal targeting signal receptor [Hanseniaspora osmophila]
MADCSVNANPLAKLNKHAGENKLFHQASGRGTSQQSAFQNAFQNAQLNGSQSSLGFTEHNNVMRNKPMLLHHPSQQSLQGSPSPISQHHQQNQWRSEFHSQSAPSLVDLQNQHTQMTNELSSHGHSSSQMFNPNMNMLNTSMRASSSMMLRGNMGASNLAYSARAAAPVSANTSASLQHNQDMSKQWEDQFLELEKQVEQNLTLQEGKQDVQLEKEDDAGIQSFEEVKFEEVWDDLQKQKEELDSSIANENTSTSQGQENDEYYQAYYNMYTNKPTGNYKFTSTETNQYHKNPNAYEMGVILMDQGAKLSEAILCFEAAVQQDEKHLDAWLKLGQCNIANELETQGIAALEKVIELNPQHLEAMMNLSVSYINEGYDLTAYNMLSNWLQIKYQDSSSNYKPVTQDKHGHELSILDKTLNKFNHILSNNGRSIALQDKEFQLGLGLLYYTKGDFDQTIDCFQTALEAQPEDEIMWNRLGATLANANRSEDAIHAYQRALQLKPTFVRARYNMAVACINIGCFKEATESLLGALSLHEVEDSNNAGLFETKNATDSLLYEKYSANIMETLKRAFIAMNRRDLLERIGPTGTKLELSQFRSEFDF